MTARGPLPGYVTQAASAAAGFGIMGAEIAGGRLLAPSLGTSTAVWSLLIATVMGSMVAGYALGGRLARRPLGLQVAFGGVAVAGAALALLPLLARPLLGSSLDWFHAGRTWALAGAGLAASLLFAPPIALLAALGPVLLQHVAAGGCDAPAGPEDPTLESRGANRSPRAGLAGLPARSAVAPGVAAARLGAAGTVGSLAGTLLSGVWLVPWLGTDVSLRLFGAILCGTAVMGLAKRGRVPAGAAAATALALIAGAVPVRPVQADPSALFQAESAYGYVRVTEDAGLRRLWLNEGYAVQSVARADGRQWVEGVWGYSALAPAFTRRGRPGRVLLLGLGGGTTARLFARPPFLATVVGVELDPVVADVARRFFDLPPSVRVEIADARSFVARDRGAWDVVILDAYQFPYLPFHLVTVEAFAAIRARLDPGGALLVNVGRAGGDHAVVDAVAATASRVFGHVAGADVPGTMNTILVATDHPLEDAAGPEAVGHEPAVAAALRGLPWPSPWTPADGAPVLTDARAPVEWLTDGVVFRRLAARAWR